MQNHPIQRAWPVVTQLRFIQHYRLDFILKTVHLPQEIKTKIEGKKNASPSTKR